MICKKVECPADLQMNATPREFVGRIAQVALCIERLFNA
jgi:hypothetical protein